MKKLVLLFLFGFVLFSANTYAQIKIGYINSAELLQQMPEVKAADAKLQAMAKQLEDKEKEMITEYQKKITQFQNEEPSLMESVKELRYNEIMDLQTRIQKFQDKAQQDLMKEKEKLYTPILDKAEAVIKEVAKENGFKYVFDSSAGSILYAEDADNIMSLVKKKMNLP